MEPLPYHQNSLEYAARLTQLPGFIWLDSGAERAYGGRYDILSALPEMTLTAPSLERLLLNGEPVKLDVDSWIQQQLARFAPMANSLPFCGGVMGYVAYEYRHRDFGLTADVPSRPKPHTPLLQLGVYNWALIQDHQTQQSWLYFDPSSKLTQQIHSALATPTELLRPTFSCGPFYPATTKAQYLRKAERILAYIQAGDTYQVNLAQQFNAQFGGSSFAAYLKLREASPSPFGAYIATAPGAILCLSPEQFIGIQENLAKTFPIKGTAARSSDLEQDRRQAQQLAQSTKNRAENVMIVDLLRNDFSRNCQPFSVKTPELCALKSFANVHHLISQVQGHLNPGVNGWQFFTDCFPGGSITGAPKKRAMEIIAELEDQPRNIYCGSIGYWSANGNMDTNIAIRTLLIEQENIYVWGGGGIVADSIPEDEYAESLQKIALLQQTLTQNKM